MTATGTFQSPVVGRAHWPKPPEVWSYSSLQDATECPRRWSLSRGSYPSVWNQPGYPKRPVLSALVGDVVHHVLETVLRAFHARGCQSRTDGAAVAVLRELGGYTKLVETAIDEQIRPLEQNPRMADHLESLRVSLNRRVPEIRARIQNVITRIPLAASEPSPARRGQVGGRTPLLAGSHPEVELRAPSLRFVGRADLLAIRSDGVVITDYKTGEPDPHHAEQLRTYALLWRTDAELNPANLPVTGLVIAYTGHHDVVDPPSASDLDHLTAHIQARIEQAEAELRMRPPPAKPAPAMCRHCRVRHLCEDYWAQLRPNAGAAGPSEDINYADYEGHIVRQNGPKSWLLRLELSDAEVLLRTPTESPGFRVGDHIRILDVATGFDDDTQRPVSTIMRGSEVFVLTP